MKLVLAMLFAVSTAFAGTGKIVSVCTDTKFQDLSKIVITEGEEGTVVVTEVDSKNIRTSSVQAIGDIIANDGVILSSWNGYSRTLVLNGLDSYIVATDECSQSITTVTCTK